MISSNTVYIIVNGIYNQPSNLTAWTDRAVTWIHLNTPHRAEKFEYATGAILRRVKQHKRAQALSALIMQYASFGFEVSLVGHSNGCDIILRAIKMLPPEVKLYTVHLIAAACEADMKDNGLFKRLNDWSIRGVYIYGSHNDRGLWFGKITQSLKFIGLGYGTLGRDGPKNIEKEYIIRWKDRFRVIFKDNYDHGTWFNEKNFNQTMSLITNE